jgi:DNA-binding transcriptional LysR family regulator
MPVGLDLFRLLVFVTVVDRGGYSAAAEHLHLSQATVSFHVRELSRHFGVPLVLYEHRSIHLTAAGEEVYRTAVRILRDAERLERAVLDISHGYRGRLSVGVSMAYVLSWQRPADVHYEPLHTATFTFLVCAEHRLARQELVTVREIAQAGLITAPLDDLEWSYYGGILRRCGLEGVAPALEIDGVQARVLAASVGLGVFGTFYPPYADERAYGPLVPLRVDRPLPAQEVGVVVRREQRSSAGAQAFISHLRGISSAPTATSA